MGDMHTGSQSVSNMKRTNKHQNMQPIVLNNLIGGINVSNATERIPDTDMSVCKNFIYDRDKRLRARGGLSDPIYTFSSPVIESYYDVDANTLFFFCENQDIYKVVVGQTAENIGKTTGTAVPMCAKFMDKLWIASGGNLQYYDYVGLYTVTDSPQCDICYTRLSRLMIAMTGNDRAYFSAVGDGTDWENITDSSQGTVASSAQYIDIGYGDSGDILSVVPLSTDLMFIKSNGMIYQLISDMSPSSWQVPPPVATNTDPIGDMTAINIGSEVVYLSRRGLKTLSTVMDYGNIKTSDIGDKFNKKLTENMWNPQFFNMKRHSMILIRPYEDKTYLIAYNYMVGAGTELDFALPITSIVETADEVYVTSGNNVYRWDYEYLTDAGKEITYTLKPHDIISTDEMLVKYVDTSFSADYAGSVKVETGNLKVTMPTNSRRKVLCNHSTPRISLTVTSNNQFIFDHLILGVADL